MSISKTYFTGTTTAANRVELYEWLSANATEYFDTIEDRTVLPSGDGIFCEIGGKEVLRFLGNDNGSDKTKVTLKNGKTITDYVVVTWKTATKTDNEIYLRASNGDDLFVTKTTDGTVLLALILHTTASRYPLYLCDFSRSANFTIIGSEGANSFCVSAGKTGLVNMVSDAGTHCDNLFLVPFTQFAGQSDIVIDKDGTKYVYNGIFALKE